MLHLGQLRVLHPKLIVDGLDAQLTVAQFILSCVQVTV